MLIKIEITPDTTQWYVIGVYNGGNNGVISYCYIHDLYGPPFLMFGQWNGLLLEYNHLARTQSDAAQHAEGISDGGSDNVVVRYSLFEDVAGTAQIAQINGPRTFHLLYLI